MWLIKTLEIAIQIDVKTAKLYRPGGLSCAAWRFSRLRLLLVRLNGLGF